MLLMSGYDCRDLSLFILHIPVFSKLEKYRSTHMGINYLYLVLENLMINVQNVEHIRKKKYKEYIHSYMTVYLVLPFEFLQIKKKRLKWGRQLIIFLFVTDKVSKIWEEMTKSHKQEDYETIKYLAVLRRHEGPL